jgi:M6 family metalloprotease-like protein
MHGFRQYLFYYHRRFVMKKICLLPLILLPAILFSAYLENLPTQVTQPDGTVLNLLASGDEFANRLHDANGYSIIQSQTDGYFYYATKNGDELAPSVWKAGTVDPAGKGLVPKLNISEAEYKARAQLRHRNEDPGVRTPTSGTVNNLCIFIRFADQTEFDTPRSVFAAKFNAVGDEENSLRNYYLKTSYNQLDITTSLYPVCQPEENLSYQDSQPRNYFIPYNAVTNPIGYNGETEMMHRQQVLLANAINALSAQIPTTLDIDADNNNYVDNISFIIRGGHTYWAELLWGRSWDLDEQEVYINGIRVWDYTFLPENQNDVVVHCHEMFHSIGSPDLYHYSWDGVSPVGCWDLMENGYGHMTAHMKNKYCNWLPAPTVISQTGDYTLNPITSATGNHYQINVNGVPGESIHLEYRKKGSDIFESFLPDSGLLIYRVRNTLTGNAYGPPDEVYIYRPDGSATLNGQVHNAAFSANRNRTEFNDYTNPNCFLTNNVAGHVNISNISFCGETISFHYEAGNTDLPPTLSIDLPSEGSVLGPETYPFMVTATGHGSTIAQVEFKLDGIVLDTFTAEPFVYWWTADQTNLGWHDLTVTATTSSGLISHKQCRFRVIDPLQENWFTWTCENPLFLPSYTCALSPLQMAIDLDLGWEDYIVKKLAFNIEDDPFGDPTVPGLVSFQINRFANGAVTNEVLLNLGDFNIPLNGHHEIEVNNNTIINGEIALIINTYEFQSTVFDLNGITGHSWFSSGNGLWFDALSSGFLGAADLSIKLQSPNAGNDENVITPTGLSLSNYPNPFNPETTISYTLPVKGQVCLDIYNSKGQLVRRLLNEPQAKGEHSLTWNGKDDAGRSVASGLYLCRITSAGKHESRKLLLLK